MIDLKGAFYRYRYVFMLAAAFLFAGCEGIQSMLEPHGEGARWIAQAWWWMFAVAMIIFVGYLVMLTVGLFPRWFGYEDAPPTLTGTQLILAGGVILPILVFIWLSFLTVFGGRRLATSEEPPSDQPVIEVVGHQWWWEVRYPGSEPYLSFETANEIHLPVGQPVRIEVTTADVIHSFWVPNLHGKIDLLPGKTNSIEVTAEEPGTYRGQCNQYCGAQHANMALYVVAHPPEEYNEWIEDQRQPARQPDDPFLEEGRRAFLDNGCTFCHSVQGIGAGEVGVGSEAAPDLTHVGSRLTIAAGLLPTNRGNIQAWIVDNENLKPGNHMPDFDELAPNEVRAMAAYLESLK